MNDQTKINADTATSIGDLDLIITQTCAITQTAIAHGLPHGEIIDFIDKTFSKLNSLGVTPEAAPSAPPEPAVSVRSSVKQDYIVCLEDGKKLKMLKRYLRTNYNMTPEEYREKWGLPRDYPMVAPAYAEQRRTLANSIGLGRKAKAAPAPVSEARTPAKRGPKPKVKVAEAA